MASPTSFHTGVRDGDKWQHVDLGSLTGPLRFGALGWRDRLSIFRAALPALAARPRGGDLGDIVSLAKLDTRAASDGLTARAADYFTGGPHEFLWGVPTERLSFAMLALQLHVFKGELREVRGGAGRLPTKMAATLDVRLGDGADKVEEAPTGTSGERVLLRLASGVELRARAAVLATPADHALDIWSTAPTAVREHLSAVRYSRIDYVYFRTRSRLSGGSTRGAVGMQVVTVPEVDGLLGGIYYANDWAQDTGLLLVTASPGGGAAALSDDELVERLRHDLVRLLPEVRDEIVETVAMRDAPYTPTFAPGSVRRLAALRKTLPAGSIDLAGDHMTAPWAEGAVRSGQLAAARIASRLRG